MDSNSWLVTSVFGGIVTYCLYRLSTTKYNYWKIRGVPAAFPLPLVGNFITVILGRKGLIQFFDDLYREFEGNRLCGYFQFNKPVLMVRDPNIIQQMFVKDFIHFEDRTTRKKTDSHNLSCLSLNNLTGDEWRTARHKLTPIFISNTLKKQFYNISDCTNEALMYLKRNTGTDLNSRELCLKFFINVNTSVAFGLKLDTLQGDQENKFFKMTLKVIGNTGPNILNTTVRNAKVDNFFIKLVTHVLKYRDSWSKRSDFLQLMINGRNEENKQCMEEKRAGDLNNIDTLQDSDDEVLLEQLRNIRTDSHKKSSELFTDYFITSQALLFISGGSDLLAATLSFVLHELAVHMDLQQRVRDEIENVLYTNDFNYDALKKMTYMEQFINETIRLHPISATIMRVCTRDYKIPEHEVTLMKGDQVVVSVVGMYNDPQYFPNPGKFDPDRFENPNTIPKGVYYSFGIGPRNCIAMRLAMLEMKLFLAKLLINFNVVLSEKTQLPIKLTNSSILQDVQGGLWVKFENRKS